MDVDDNLNGWKKFPETAPKTGVNIVVGGFTKKKQWVEILASWGTFNEGWHPMCEKSADLKGKWMTSGYMTIDNYVGVDWITWHPRPTPPIIL